MVQETIDRIDDREYGYLLRREGDTIHAQAKHGGSVTITADEAESIVETEGSEWGEAEATDAGGDYVRVAPHPAQPELDVHFTSDEGEVRSNPFDGNHLVSVSSSDLADLVAVEA